MTALAPTLQAFFTDRLTRQRHARSQTAAAYRDTWRLLLVFTSGQPSQLDFTMPGHQRRGRVQSLYVIFGSGGHMSTGSGRDRRPAFRAAAANLRSELWHAQIAPDCG